MAICITTKFKDYLSSGWEFSVDEYLQKQRFYLLNIVVALGFVAIGQGIVYDILHDRMAILVVDIIMLLFFATWSVLLRKDKKYYEPITSLSALLSLLYLDFLMAMSQFEDMEFIWLFFFIVTYMFLKGPKIGVAWNLLLFASLFVLKLQPFFEIDFTYTQIVYLIFTLSIVTTVTYFFQHVIDESYQLIFSQRQQLQEFNEILEQKVQEKTDALQHLNENLSETVARKVAVVEEQQEMLMAQSRLAAMGEMLSMIAHQWRQPLSTTTLRISQLQIKSMMENKRSDDRDTLLEEVSDTLVYLSNTIDDFQTYFKPDNKSEKVNVSSLVERATGFIKARTDMYQIEVRQKGEVDLTLETFPNELVQVLINILNNAVDAIVSSKPSEKYIEIDIEVIEENVCIMIRDSADGIEEQHLKRIFEPYFSTKSENGTGLGLYMAKMIIHEHMSGEITATNAEQGGAEFCITMPLLFTEAH